MFSATRARAQACDLLEIWVDPARGFDEGALDDPEQIGAPNKPCKSLQFAIDKLYENLRKLYAVEPLAHASTQGIVYCMPGLYGPHGALSSGDSFPIDMRDRVHVQGVNARACVIRGSLRSNFSQDQGNTTAFWPVNITCVCGGPQCPCSGRASQVLVSFRESSQYSVYPTTLTPLPVTPVDSMFPPWVGTGETQERFDGFTLQGGDIQVWFANHPVAITPGAGIYFRAHPLSARISNCVFDMRHAYQVEWQKDASGSATLQLRGPTFGLLMTPSYMAPDSAGATGYYKFDVMVANNTFVMAERGQGTWIHSSLPEAVAILDATDPGLYFFSPPNAAPQWVDPLQQYRGLGQTCIVNNVFRTRMSQDPAGFGPMAMMGVDASDCRVRSSTSLPFEEYNAFAPNRASAGNQLFSSTPVTALYKGAGRLQLTQNYLFFEPVFDCHAVAPPNIPPPCASAALPSPRVLLWNGSSSSTPQMYDPMFVGEYLVNLSGSGVNAGYRDWRLLPTSPLIDQGFAREPVLTEHANNDPYLEDGDCAPLRTFDNDGEGYGNPRPLRDPIDIGFDEYQMMIVAGSWTNDSIVHNDNTYPSAVLQPSAVSSGVSQRHLIFHERYAGYPLAVHGTLNPTSAGGPGWVRPIGTLTNPVIDPSAGFEHRRRYISYTTDPVPPPATNPTMPWMTASLPVIVVNNYIGVPGPWWNLVPLSVCLAVQADPECQSSLCGHGYFNLQAVVDGYPTAISRHHGNLQNDYR